MHRAAAAATAAVGHARRRAASALITLTPAPSVARARAGAPTRPLSGAPAGAPGAPADAGALRMLTSFGKWAAPGDDAGRTAGVLVKTYEFRDARTAGRFVAQARDAFAAAGARAPAVALSHDGGARVVAAVGAGAAAVSQAHVDAAMAADDVAAELQLGGRWN